jgi:microcystin-dependent protein
MTKRTCHIVMFLTLTAAGALAHIDPVPATIDYQGSLLQADGVTPETGAVDIEFRLYAGKSGGVALWGERHVGVPLVEGLFAVELGAGAAIDGVPHPALEAVFSTEPLWLGITVAGEPERLERQQFASAPYALTANTAMTAVHGVPPGTIAAWAGADPPVGWLACNGESYERTGDYAKLFAAIGTVWGEGDEPGETFNVPNFGGRTPIGAMAAGEGQDENSPGETPATAGLTDHALGDLLGEETHQLTEAEMAAHTHGYTDRHWVGSESSDWGAGHAMSSTYVDTPRDTGYTGGVDTDHDEEPDAAAEHNNMQPSSVVHFIIKY